MDPSIGRRRLLTAGGVVALAAASAGCDALSTSPTDATAEHERAARGPARNPREAPVLARRVKQGDIPELVDRLPAEPMAVTPLGQVGTYGGELRVLLDDSIPLGVQRMYFFAGYDNLLSWDSKFGRVVPNLAKAFEVNSSNTEYTFRLREGVKWSDGEPFSADDVVFVVEDVLMNKDLNPVKPDWLGQVTAEAIDQHTVRLSFAEPNGLLPLRLAGQNGNVFTMNPRHYMRKFHSKYNPGAEDLARKAKLESWMDLYRNHVGFSGAPECQNTPTVAAWRFTSALDANPQVTMERNPYYWKVDPRGSQLPYIDKLAFIRADPQVGVLKISQGDVDLVMQILTFQDKPVLARNRRTGKFHFQDMRQDYMNTAVIHLNLTHEDPVKRRIFQDKNFRIGLSHAINRPEIVDGVFQRQGEPWQVAPRKESSYLDMEMAKQYTDYDVAKANEYLDRAFPKKNSDGIRLGPDGTPISFKLAISDVIAALIPACEPLVDYWAKVGVKMSLQNVSRELLISTGEANRHDAIVWIGDGGLDATMAIMPYNYVPMMYPWAFYAVRWGQWYTSRGAQGERPPADVRRQLDLYAEFKKTGDQDRRTSLMTEIVKIAKNNFFTIGISLPPETYTTVTDSTKNQPKFVSGGDWVYSSPGPTNPSQYFTSAG